MRALAVLAFAAIVSTALTVPQQKSSNHRNLRMGKTIEYAPGRTSLFMSRYGNGTNQKVGGSIWPVSIYWTTVEVGTPLKSYAVAIDSGSYDMYLSGKGCNGCVTTPPNTQYDPKESSSSVGPLPGPGFSATYETCNPTHPLESCTISGPEYTDVASLGGYGPTRVKMGAISYQTSNFYQFQTIDGIIGMVKGAQGNVFYELCVAGHYCEPVWAICMVEGTKSNGTITIGGVDESLADGPITYVPSPNNTFGYWHKVEVHDLTMSNGKKVTVGQHAILDTGTNDLLVPDTIFSEVQQSVCANSPKHCNDFFNSPLTCHSLTDDEVAAYPNINFQLDNGLVLEMTPRDYLLKHSPAASSPDQYCFGISNGGNFFIIGDSLMQNYYLVFGDAQVGWGKVNKKTCGSV